MHCRYTSISCPTGFVKLDADGFAHSCSRNNITCPQGVTCMCSPCKTVLQPPRIAYEGYAFTAPSAAESANNLMLLSQQIVSSNNDTTSCQRMEVCATFKFGATTYMMVRQQTLLVTGCQQQ